MFFIYLENSGVKINLLNIESAKIFKTTVTAFIKDDSFRTSIIIVGWNLCA